MQVFYALATFGGAPLSITGLTFKNSAAGAQSVPKQCSRIYVEPASGTHTMFVEVAGLATGATGGTDGVVRQLAAYSATGPLDSWEVADQKGGNLIDLTQFQLDGTSGETARVTVYVA